MTNKDWDSIANQAQEEIDTMDNRETSEDMFDHDDEQSVVSADIREERANPSFAALEERLKEAEEKASENWEKAVRALSDLENIRKRSERDIANAHKYSIEKFAKELLAVVDSLEQALTSSEQTSDVMREGVELTLKILIGTLEKFSIKQLDPKGDVFDPNLHEAVSMLPTKDAAPNTVVDVFQKGYILYDRVIRPARVVVAKALD